MKSVINKIFDYITFNPELLEIAVLLLVALILYQFV